MLYPRNETLSGYGLDASWISWLKMNIMTIALNATCYGKCPDVSTRVISVIERRHRSLSVTDHYNVIRIFVR